MLGGDQDEVQRILSDLNRLTQVQEHSKENAHGNMGSNHSSPVPMPSPLPSRPPLGMDEVLDNLNLSFLNEAKYNY